MKKSKKNSLAAAGMILVLLLAGVIFFFTYYQVDEVQVMGSSHYSEKQIKKMVLRGPLASNSVLAPLLYTKQNTKDVPFIEGYTVTRLNRHTICVSVKEKDIVGCIPYLDSYIYFDRNGIFVEGSTERNEKIPFFDGIKVKKVIQNEKLPIKDETVMNTAVALSTIFAKNDKVPDHIEFEDDGQISRVYGDITVKLGKDEYLEDKMVCAACDTYPVPGFQGVTPLEYKCDQCGECYLNLTGGICPITACSKSLVNGQCGGSKNGKCEVDSDMECGWERIYRRLKEIGRLDALKCPTQIHNFATDDEVK